MNVRVLAAKMMIDVILEGRSLTELHQRAEADLDNKTLSTLKYLTFETCRHYHKYQAVLDQIMDKPFKDKDADLQALVIIGMHELTQADKADHAAINEAVSAVRELKKDWAVKLVNALLRLWQRSQSDPDTPWLSDIRYQTGHPGWIAKRIRKDWPEYEQQICLANNTQAPMTIRVNQLKTSRSDYLLALSEKGIIGHPTKLSQDGIQLEKACSVDDLPGFFNGLCSVQDEAAQLAASLLGVSAGDHVLDACCAPGGKTGHLLELGAKNVVAVDVDESRLTRVQENLSRLDLTADLKIADLSNNEWWDGVPFDRILLDAPCSATGVIRRHPDIKLLRRPTDITPLVELQREILQQLWSMLKPGGILLYATCSILKAENIKNINWFLGQVQDAEQLPLIQELELLQGQLLPDTQGNDGFFFAKLKKLESSI